jgi:hypothetical protein
LQPATVGEAPGGAVAGGTRSALASGMTDIGYIALVIAFFAVAWAYTRSSEHL